jgi:hypothetical protein
MIDNKIYTVNDSLCNSYTYNTQSISNIINDAIAAQQEEKKPDVSVEVKTELCVKYGTICVKNYDKGFFQSERTLIPDIKDIKSYNDTTVIVIFADDTKTVAVLDPKDKFDLEQGISICLMKRLLGDNGSSIYNKLIKRAFEVKEQNEEAVKKAEEKKAEDKAKKEAERQRQQKANKRKREEAIEIQKEAYIRAMEYMESKNNG